MTASIAMLAATSLHAQAIDYAKADRIRTFDPMLVGGRVYPTWLDDSVRFYYETNGSGADRGTRYLVDPRARTRRAIADTMGLRAAAGTRPVWAVRSPDGQWDAFAWNYNVYVRPARLSDADPTLARWTPRLTIRNGCDTRAIAGPLAPRDSVGLPAGSIAVTTDGAPDWGYGLYHFGMEVAQAERDRYQLSTASLQWSPDSKRLAAKRDDLRGVRTYPLYSSTSNQPVDHRYFYAAPGDSAFMRFDFYALDVAGRTAVKLNAAPIGALNLPGEVRWGRTGDELYVLTSTRGSKSVQLASVDARTGASRVIARDSARTFVEMTSGGWTVVNGGEDVLWISERDGWGHIYRYGRDGTLKNQVERGDYKVADIIRVDSVKRRIYFTAWGKEPGVPNYAHLYRIGFDGTGLTSLTPEPGNHTIRVAPKGLYFIDTYSQIATPPVTVLRDGDGKIVMELARGDDAPLRAIGWTPSEVFTVKARDGATDLYGVMHKPSTFDPSRRYPVVVTVYPGPQRGSVGDWVFKGPDWVTGYSAETRQTVRNTMRSTGEEGQRRALAELGFIVVQVDALGSSPQRSKAFEDYFYGRVSDNGLLDQIAAVRQLAAKYPWMDTSRVGVFGHSGGGFTAGAAMVHHPEFFKVGVAASGNHDFRVYGWYWGEKYQGLYERAGDTDNYEEQANYKYAANLKGRLMLMTGDMDCNNPPAETIRFVDALERAGKDFDFLLAPDYGHQLPTYTIKRTWDYFVRYLMGGEPSTTYQMIGP